MKKIFFSIILVIGLMLLVPTLIAQNYAVTVLPSPAANQTYAWDINDVGQIVGCNVTLAGTIYVYDIFRWDSADSVYLVANPIGWRYKAASFINNLGWIAGQGLENTGGYSQGLIWDNFGDFMVLSKPESWKDVQVSGINGVGQVCGRIDDAAGLAHAILWDAAGHHVLTHEGWTNSWPLDINDFGQIVGRVWRNNNGIEEHHAGLWNGDGTFVDVHPPGAIYSLARSINDKGQILVWTWSGAEGRAFIRDRKGIYREVPTPIGWRQEGPASINNKGQVLMRAISAPTVFDLYLVDHNGRCFGLPRPKGWNEGSIWGDGLNNKGEIVGQGYDPDGIVRALYWEPTGRGKKKSSGRARLAGSVR